MGTQDCNLHHRLHVQHLLNLKNLSIMVRLKIPCIRDVEVDHSQSGLGMPILGFPKDLIIGEKPRDSYFLFFQVLEKNIAATW